MRGRHLQPRSNPESRRHLAPFSDPDRAVPIARNFAPSDLDLCSSPKLVFGLFGTPLGAGELRTDRPGELSKWATAGIRAASVASGLDLLVCSHVGLRCLRVQLGSGNLPLVPLGESLVHRSTLHHPAGSARRWHGAESSRARCDGEVRAPHYPGVETASKLSFWIRSAAMRNAARNSALERSRSVAVRAAEELPALKAGIFRARRTIAIGADPAPHLNSDRGHLLAGRRSSRPFSEWPTDGLSLRVRARILVSRLESRSRQRRGGPSGRDRRNISMAC